MVQVDLSELRTKWYNLGKAGTAIAGTDAELFNSLDPWQKRELRNAYVEGTTEALSTVA
ncbi:hypothetical protein FDG95_gp376 [Pectobacterium phage vB_PcaM_CBB]|uniref:Uncharacterized protein n=1 Tax=Pectobacterium phage vB_PcaM_CBB TaxID=2772511 RepID=A0A1L2CUB8_9CAUD|nr:hypothetical protein FDG95_gp050 [Pectobacterium phage vB_PcaM_CBB]YP_009595143.1 hypothetical protein FDG95_gp376 [Pectobacterium phage vB_PcaM_CBB]AMM43615.1 hypothetical protein CBB_50 [Pectobacterium phage vB_PcaM_CBB]AMM44166.1 hypothetical protein CBB_603 [Pectobacterium phage vB_PcaM_CBB]